MTYHSDSINYSSFYPITTTFDYPPSEYATSTNTTTVRPRKSGRTIESAHRQRRAANERERRRMSSINRGFDKLRVKLPQTAYEKKPSKVDTLRQAIDYIHRLKEILDESGGSGDGGSAPIRISAQPLPPPPPPPNRVVIECPIVESISDNCFRPSIQSLSLSWSKATDKYGSASRSYVSGVAHATTSKVWVPGVVFGNNDADDDCTQTGL